MKHFVLTGLLLSALTASAQVEVDSLNRLLVGDRSVKMILPSLNGINGSTSDIGIVGPGGKLIINKN